ncbi:MAG: GH3 auxin-responsive promoter family protein, partial [Erysipelotrichaceae bacterium]|nr:GH3 auxin-responsive promoter family protein [Erysipelotrichaceae bacterium]
MVSIDSCYYEFIPVDDETKILSLDELEIGKEYEIVITNQAGFYRYRCGDVIKVLDYLNYCPYINFSSRKGTLLNITGE